MTPHRVSIWARMDHATDGVVALCSCGWTSGTHLPSRMHNSPYEAAAQEWGDHRAEAAVK